MESDTPVVYRCMGCSNLSELEPRLVRVHEWDTASEQWVSKCIRLCVDCVTRTRGAYRRTEGGFLR